MILVILLSILSIVSGTIVIICYILRQLRIRDERAALKNVMEHIQAKEKIDRQMIDQDETMSSIRNILRDFMINENYPYGSSTIDYSPKLKNDDIIWDRDENGDAYYIEKRKNG